MDNLIETIRAAAESDASENAKHQGALACRTLLAALEAKVGEPLPPPSTPSASATPVQDVPQAQPDASATEPQQIAAIVGALRGMPVDQLLDLAIARLRAAIPNDAPPPALAPLRFQIIPITSLAPTMGSTERGVS